MFPKKKPTPPVQIEKKPEKPQRKKLGHCFVTDKTMYEESLARQESERMKRRTPNNYLRAYRCQYCEAWHLTHKRRYK